MRTKILVTGSAGFIGSHVASALLAAGEEVVGLDNLNDYYDVSLKLARNARLKEHPNYTFYQLDLCDHSALQKLFQKENIGKICHLAAQPGVRYSIENPFVYQKTNNEGFLNVIECARHFGVKQFLYASSSSVYGGNKKVPFSVTDRVDSPVSLYAATKKSNELVARTYRHLYGINAIGLRLFTVYGPWGRPDMAYFSFSRAIVEDRPIRVFNHGKMRRDFTFIDDIVSGIRASLNYTGSEDVFNLGNDQPVGLLEFIGLLEKFLGKKAQKEFLPMQAGDVVETWADIGPARKELGYDPKTGVEQGLEKFVQWFRKYALKGAAA
jgi:UDP-glucuronate 4-epimerase